MTSKLESGDRPIEDRARGTRDVMARRRGSSPSTLGAGLCRHSVAMMAAMAMFMSVPAYADKADREDIGQTSARAAALGNFSADGALPAVFLPPDTVEAPTWSGQAAIDFNALDIRVNPASARGEPFGDDWTPGGVLGWWFDPHLQPRGNVVPIDLDRYGFDTLANQLYVVWPEAVLILGGMSIKGYTTWNWGSSGFHFKSEGWFGRGSYGMDKLGHAYTTYMITELITDRINHKAVDTNGAAIAASLVAMTTMFYVEIFDGFSGDHGFSYEDLIADAVGAGFSVLRSTVPGLQEKLDYRLQYIPSGNKGGFHPITDYSGQKYILALKLAGFDAFRDTPLRFLELQVGYYARGFTDKEKAAGDAIKQRLYAGIGINLQELLFGWDSVRDTKVGRGGRRFFEYFQAPYTYVGNDFHLD